LEPGRREAIIREALLQTENGGRRGLFDAPPRALEHLQYTFEILVDFGAFRDIQRHRIATQQRQPLTPYCGYSIPREAAELDLEPVFRECLERAAEVYETIAATHPNEAAYVLPLAYRLRLLFTCNLRELHHFITLRSSKQGHISYRRIAQEMWRLVAAESPLMASFIRVDMHDYTLARDAADAASDV